ncbi:MAG: NADH:flavin oxidoreductase [Lachnospiraceae bacterium]|nr:NADH:flavin oxidoreductase [Lachnospiraceae bacterium]
MKASDSLEVRGKVIRNRITMAPTVKFDYAGPDGKATEKHIEHYRERAEHGCGLICVEATAVSPDGRFWTNHMGLWDDDQIEGHSLIAKACHDNGAVVIVQINHTGITSNPDCGPAIGPSSVPTRDPNVMSKEMNTFEIHKMQENFVNAAVRAKKAGYDGVQLHGCHSYLINQFISKKTNLRTDEYGGSVENRARFGAEIIKAVRKECGEDFIISIRTAGIEPDVATAIEIAEEYVKAGVDMLQVSTGIEWDDPTHKEEGKPYNKFAKLGVRFHDHFKGRIPVSCVNSLYEPSVIRYLLENDLVDLVDLGRPILADPAIVEAVLEYKPFVKCFDCPNCQYGPFMPHKCPAAIKRGVKFE